MIIVKLQGGLGNQMFQYAMGRAISLRTASDVFFDNSWYVNVPDGETKRPFELDIFSLTLQFVWEQDMPLEVRGGYYNYYNTLLRKIPWRSVCGLPSWNIWLDHFPEIQNKIAGIRADQNVYLQGYWQSEKYFKEVEDVIHNDFSFSIPPDDANQAILDKIAADSVFGLEAVSVHIRRGDYSSDPKTKAHHGLLPLGYYKSAMAVIEKRFHQVCYYVFSDDLAWCRKNLRFKGEAVFVDVNKKLQGWMDMRLMSRCHHHIIANSSFSWWAAWLNANKDKMVVAPQEWLSDSKLINKDMLPGDWLKI